MARKKKKTDPFEELTWSDLTAWAGSKIVSRGKNYQRNGYVEDLARTSGGSLIAWVEGTERYATKVFFEDGELESNCTCPYWDTCKHAVAVVIEYLDCLKRNVKIPKATQKDRRLKPIEALGEDGIGFNKEDDMDEFDEYFHPQTQSADISFLEPFLKKHTKAQLIKLVKNLAERHPNVSGHLLDKVDLSKGTVNNMVDSVRNEIMELSSEPGWQNHWRNEGYTPDYSRVKHRFEALLDQGFADELIALGEELMTAGTSQVEMSHDEGETEEEIASCMDVVFRALPQSSLSPSEQMLWAVDRELEDQWALCEGVEVFWQQEQKKTDWTILADQLIKRLNRFSKPDDRYLRDRLADWIITALANSGRDDEIIPLCEKEAVKTGSYIRLVRILIEAEQWKPAEQWIHKGIKATQEKWPGLADQLRTALREIREKQGDWLQVAALRADDFFTNPSLETFKKLQKAVRKAKVWAKIKPVTFQYLETGELPGSGLSWPLPETGVLESDKCHPRQFPLIETLINIAIDERKPDDVIRWYDQGKGQKFDRWGTEYQEDKIAVALADHYPDRAMDIWKRLAANLIAQVKPKAYENASVYLAKVQRILKQQKRGDEWVKCLSRIRKEHARKRRLIEILGDLDGSRIMDVL
ncbi:MAG: SWIM zinc finger domain-containing protein [Deltaproteobacteria bacterium]|nr:SWIM zinc finger domain-containing protein [Deltaproteobacteria bacterium]